MEDLALNKTDVALGVTPEAIKNFNEDAVLNIIKNTFTSHDTSTLNAINFQPTFNPIDKLVEVVYHRATKYVLLLAFIIISTNISQAQPFKPDKLGHVQDPKFIEVMHSKGYQLIGSFDTVSKADPNLNKQPIIAAKAYKDGHLTYIDLQGIDLRKAAPAQGLYNPVRVPEIHSDAGMGISIPDVQLNEKFEQVVENGKYGTRNIQTKKIGLPVTYDGLVWMGNGLIQIKTGDQYGFATSAGKVLLAPRYESINTTGINDKKGKPLYYSIRKEGKAGLMDTTFKEIVPPAYTYVTSLDYYTKIFLTLKDRKFGLVSKGGNEIVPVIYTRIRAVGKGLPIIVTNGSQSGLIDSTGKILLGPVYETVELDNDQKQFRISQKGRSGTVDYNGKFKQKPDFDYTYLAGHGVTIVSRDNKFGAVDFQGNLIIPLEYDNLDFDYPVFVAKKGNIPAILNLQGKPALTGAYEELQSVNGLLLYKLDGKFGLMSKNGKKLTQLDYTYVHADHNYLIALKDGKFGVVTTNNKIVVPFKYDRFRGGEGSIIRDGLLEAVLQNDRYMIDLYGNEEVRR